MNTCSVGCTLYIRCALSIHQKECQESLGCALYTGKYGNNNILVIFISASFAEIHREIMASIECNGVNLYNNIYWK
jgi:hypothetical protein